MLQYKGDIKYMINKFGVPCSKLKKHIKEVSIHCTDESQAMALACGAWLAGQESEVYMQNSGLGNCVDIITSLYKPYDIPLPKLLLSIRTKPEQHAFMGKITEKLLEILEYAPERITKIIQEDE